MMWVVETRCISPISLERMPSYSVKKPYAKISAKMSARLPDNIIYISDRPIYRKTSVLIHSLENDGLSAGR